MSLCVRCDKPVTNPDWSHTINGPVHNACRSSDNELEQIFLHPIPCIGCSAVCAQCEPQVSAMHYADGIESVTVWFDDSGQILIDRHNPLYAHWPAQLPTDDDPTCCMDFDRTPNI